ncbi:MAG: UPF0164 family protein [Spirochaetaceae bacterium]|nr:UPF0164 family protein [Spirochaetaceae bacterium]MCF7948713.1 UPF0164 family protein [Spirochaetia bacterium]MCF7951145.1 UPF0164 family protein [Spirochaetaceae bacterium]
MKMKHLWFFSIIIIFLPVSIYAADLSDFYYGYSGFAENSLFSDPNTGRTLFPTLLVPMGGMYEGMGTAYTAVAEGSGFLEANPAGSSQLTYTELSFHHNNWIADSSLEGVVYTIRDGNFGMGFGGKFLYLPFTEFNSWGERDSRGYVSETIATLNASYNFLSSYYFHGISVGANLKLAYRHIPASIYPGQSIATGLADVGALTRFNFLKFYSSRERNFSLGTVVKNLGLPYDDEPMPTVAVAGFAYSPFRPLLLSFDFNYPVAIGLPPEQWEKWYIASGMQLQFTNFFSVHTGFTHRGANPRFSLGSNIELDYIDLILNYTLDLTTQVSSADRFSIEAKMNLGDRGRAELRQQIDEYYIEGLEAYAQGELKRAIDYWEAALSLDPTFEPATENMVVARNSLRLQEDMESLNKVE